jgi:hypothetical protein
MDWNLQKWESKPNETRLFSFITLGICYNFGKITDIILGFPIKQTKRKSILCIILLKGNVNTFPYGEIKGDLPWGWHVLFPTPLKCFLFSCWDKGPSQAFSVSLVTESTTSLSMSRWARGCKEVTSRVIKELSTVFLVPVVHVCMSLHTCQGNTRLDHARGRGSRNQYPEELYLDIWISVWNTFLVFPVTLPLFSMYLPLSQTA